jgi:hypothetical protein
MRSRTVGFLAAAVLMVPMVAACGSDPLNTKCADFIKKSESEQLDLSARWGTPDGEKPDAAAEIEAPDDRRKLSKYCADHLDVKLSEIPSTL